MPVSFPSFKAFTFRTELIIAFFRMLEKFHFIASFFYSDELNDRMKIVFMY